MTVLAVFALSLRVGTWAGIRIGETSARIDLASYLLATIPKEEN